MYNQYSLEHDFREEMQENQIQQQYQTSSPGTSTPCSTKSSSCSRKEKPNLDDEKCRVCSTKAHGTHFGVISCRACAAFFRRKIVKDLVYTCRTGLHACEVGVNAKAECKLCRFDKCIQVGMTPNNIQLNRDSISSAVIKSSTTKMEVDEPAEELPGRKLAFERTVKILASDPKSPFNKHFMKIKDRVEAIFCSAAWIDTPSTSWLSRMEHALVKRRAVVSRNPEFLKSIKIADLWPLQNDQKVKMAEWMMECPAFATLPLNEKWYIYEYKCKTLFLMERIHMTIELFGERTLTESLILISDGFCTNREQFTMDVSVISDYDHDYVNRVLNPFRNGEEMIQDMCKLTPSITELTYMMVQSMWNIEETAVTPKTLDVADRVRERFSDELHTYYTTVVNMNNYADRLHRLMSIVHLVHRHMETHKQIMELAMLFDVFKLKKQDEQEPETATPLPTEPS